MRKRLAFGLALVALCAGLESPAHADEIRAIVVLLPDESGTKTTAVPIACADDKGWIADREACLDRIEPEQKVEVPAASKPKRRTALEHDGIAGAYDRSYRGWALTSDKATTSYYGVVGAKKVTAVCRSPKRATAPFPIASFSVADEDKLDPAAKAELEQVRAALTDARYEVASELRGDFDADGKREHLVAIEVEEPELSFLVDATDSAAPVILALAGKEGPLFEARDQGWWSDFRLDASQCFDLDRDGAAELWLATGGDGERSNDYVSVGASGLTRVGYSTFSGS